MLVNAPKSSIHGYIIFCLLLFYSDVTVLPACRCVDHFTAGLARTNSHVVPSWYLTSSRTYSRGWQVIPIQIVKNADTDCFKASCSTDITISKASDATALSTCATFTGQITIATEFAGNLALDGIEVLRGDLWGDSVGRIFTISAPDMRRMGDLQINAMDSLRELRFPQLTEIGGLSLTGLVGLQALGFTKGLQKAVNIVISGTGLTSLDGVDQATDVGLLGITSNQYINNISFQGDSLPYVYIWDNGYTLAVNFPNLVTMNEANGMLTLRNCSSLSFPSLVSAASWISIAGGFLEEISFPALRTARSIEIISNAELTKLSMPALESVVSDHKIRNDDVLIYGRGLSIADNDKLEIIQGFPKLSNVTGDVNLLGNLAQLVSCHLITITAIADDMTELSSLRSVKWMGTLY